MAQRRMIVLFALVLALAASMSAQRLKEIPANALKCGDQAPPIRFRTMVQGPAPTDVNWKSLQQKVVVLEFWGTWCAPCVAGIPHPNELVEHYKGQPVQFIAVGHENPTKVKTFLIKHPIKSWIALDLDLEVYKAYTAFGIHTL